MANKSESVAEERRGVSTISLPLKVPGHELKPPPILGTPRVRGAKARNGGTAMKRISATRALKNARHLQKIAPQVMPKAEPAEGFVSVIPIHVLAHLHRPERRGQLVMGGKLAKQVKDIQFPT